jgi:hypothetical protein
MIKHIVSDILKCRATTVMIIGVLAFGALITYHSGKIFGANGPTRSRGRTASSPTMHNYLQDEMIDMEKAMTAILQNHKGRQFSALKTFKFTLLRTPSSILFRSFASCWAG